MRGTVIVNRIGFEVTGIELGRGAITIEATRWDIVGEFTIMSGDLYEIVGYDGTLIARGLLHLDRSQTAVGDAKKPAFMTVTIPIGFVNQELG